jgi:DNA repair protein RadC
MLGVMGQNNGVGEKIKSIKKIAATVLKCLDHLIISNESYYSFADERLLYALFLLDFF